jgi:anti-sigma B factor antagonist
MPLTRPYDDGHGHAASRVLSSSFTVCGWLARLHPLLSPRLRHRKAGVDELKIAVTAGPAHTLITVAGECDLNTGRQLRDVLTSEVSRGVRRLILDLSELTFMDSTGMQVLLSICTVLTVRGGTLGLVSPQPVVARILELTGADQLIPIFDSLRDAQTAD